MLDTCSLAAFARDNPTYLTTLSRRATWAIPQGHATPGEAGEILP